MRKFLSILLALTLCLCLSSQVFAAPAAITTPATGYTCAEDVEYKTENGNIVNWGAREEDCIFLTTYAQNYYTGSYTWEELSQKDGGTGTSNAYTSDLYKALQSMMKARHTNIQGYQATRPYYKYTDCANNDSSLISSFYSGKTVASVWTGQTYNREHVWPRSKCISTDKTNDSADIMMLRATITSENSSRGNSAYGESSGYFDPGASVRGDCARMVLYGYVRWGNTGKMWGSSGVMENLDILLKWMEEDPVDTWEMGRNDSVQSITGVRNVFVDYPEFAWLLFGQEIPEDMVTPSGNAAADAPHTHSYTATVTTAATCTAQGVLTYTCDCGDSYTESIPATNHKYEATVTQPTCTAQGFTTHSCACGDSYTDSYTDAQGHQWDGGIVTAEPTETEPGLRLFTCGICKQTRTEGIAPLGHTHRYTATVTPPTCTAQGFTTHSCACGDSYTDSYTDALGHQWDGGIVTAEPTETEPGLRLFTCGICKQTRTEGIAPLGHTHRYTATVTQPTCTAQGFTTHSCACGDSYTDSYTDAVGHPDGNSDRICDSCGEQQPCDHANVILQNATAATCDTDGYTGDETCADCNELITGGSAIAALGHKNTEIRGEKDATCGEKGYTGDTYCTDCNQCLSSGTATPATGAHEFSDWISNEELSCRTCIVCNFEEIEYFDTPSTTKPNSTPALSGDGSGWIAIGTTGLAVAGFLVVAIFIVKGKKRT